MKPLALVLLLLGIPAVGAAQMFGEREGREATDTEVRERCEDAVERLLQEPLGDEPERDLERVWLCEVSGPIAIASSWRNPSITSNPRARLVAISQEIHDRRVLNVVLPILEDPGEPYDLRIRALSVLAEYLVPGWRPGPGSWFSTRSGEESPVSVGSRTHAVWVQGVEPIDEAARTRIVEALRALVAPWDELQFLKVENGIEPMSSLGTSDEVRLALVARGILRRWDYMRGAP